MSRLGSFVVECGPLPLFYRDIALVCPWTGNDDLPDEGLYRPLKPLVVVPWDLSGTDTLGAVLGLEQYALQHGGRARLRHPLPVFPRPVSARPIPGPPLPGRVGSVRDPEARSPTTEEVEAGYEQAARQLYGDRGNVAAVRGRIHVPDSVPLLWSLTVDVDGHLWVGTSVQGPDGGTRPGFEVFDPEGRLLGFVDGAPRLVPEDIGTDYLLGVRYGELGVPFVELYRLHR